MEKSIDEAIKHLNTYSSTMGSGQTTQAQHEEAKRVAIGIMNKYQDIQEIVTEWQKQNDPKIKFVASNCNMTKIAEVLEGNDKKTKSSDEP